MMPLLLDTCAVIWLAEEAPIAKAAQDAVADAADNEQPVYISPISAWEIGLLVANGRLRLIASPEAWFERVLARAEVSLTNLSAQTLISSSFLPGAPPRDPADRILLATAREKNFCIVTRDTHLLRYAGEGHVKALAC